MINKTEIIIIKIYITKVFHITIQIYLKSNTILYFYSTESINIYY